MTNFSQLAALLRTYQNKLLKLNRNEDREATIVANTEAAIQLGEAALHIDKAIKVLCPFPLDDPSPIKVTPQKTGGRGETSKGKTVNSGADDWSTKSVG